MFPGFTAKAKGGLNRLNQSVITALCWLKGPADTDLTISAGDASSPRAVGNTIGRTVTIAGGAATDQGTSGSARADGGAAVLRGAAGGAAFGNGGNATVQGGPANINCIAGSAYLLGADSMGAPGDAIVKGGSVTQSTNVAGGAASVTGGTSIINNGGAASVTGGTGYGGGEVSITGGAATGANGAAGGVTIKGGAPTAGVGAPIRIEASGAVGGNRDGASVNIKPGPASGTGNGGNIQLDGGRGAALATAATSGFVTMPTCAGTPTGVPVNVPTGSVAMVFDTTAGKLWAYIGGAWKGATLV